MDPFQFLDSLEDLVFVMRVEKHSDETPSFIYEHINQAALTQLNLAQQMLGTVMDKDLEYYSYHVKAYITKEMVIYEDDFFDRFGKIRQSKSTITPFFNEQGEVVQLVSVVRDVTEEKRVKTVLHQLEESERRYKEIVEHSPDAIVIHQKGRISFVNQAAIRILGISSKDGIIGKPILSFVHPEDREQVLSRFASVYQTQEAAETLRERLLKENGDIIYGEVSATPVDYNSEPAIQVTIRDVTEQVEREQELQKTKERLDLIFQHAHDAVFVIGHNGAIIECNESFEKLFGFSREELFDKEVPPTFTESTPVELQMEILQRFREGEIVKNMPFERKRKDGKILQVLGSYTPVKDHPEFLAIGMYKDVTELKEADEQLKAKKDEIELILNHTHDAIFLWNEKGQVTRVNPAFENIYGWTEEELLSLDHNPLIPEDELPLLQEQIQDLLMGRELQNVESTRIKKDGTQRQVLASYSAIHDDQGNFLTFIGTHKDVTAEREYMKLVEENEEKLRQLINVSPDFILLKDGHGRWIEANDTAKKLFNIQSDYVGKTDLDLAKENPMYAKALEACVEIDEIAWQKGEIHREEEYVPDQEGTIHTFDTVKIPIFDEKGNRKSLVIFARNITERKKQEELLRQSKLVVEKSNAVLFQWEIEAPWRTLYVSDNVDQIGLSKKELMAGTILLQDFINQEDLMRVAGEIADYQANGIDQFILEYRYKGQDGINRWIQAHCKLERDEQGTPIYFQGVVMDITNQKKAELALEESEERFRSLFDENPDAVWAMDLEGNYTQANEAFLSYTGLTSKTMKGLNYKNCPLIGSLESQVKIAEHHFDIVQQTGDPIDFEVELFKNGKPHNFVVKFVPIYVSGELVGVYGIGKDVTDIREKEQLIHESEERYRLIAENTLDMIRVSTIEGVVTYVSPSHERVLGYPKEYFMGTIAYDDGHPEDVDKLKTILNTILNTKESCKVEYRRKHKNGYYVWLEAQVTPVFDENGEIAHILYVGRDITERKIFEKKLEHLAFHDTLTGIPNRRFFQDQLSQKISESIRTEEIFAVMYMDLDKFKPINDTYGHDVGDLLLKQFTERVNGVLRETDTLGRVGGDEFLVLLPRVETIGDVEIVAQRIMDVLQKPWEIKGHCLTTTSSIGIAFYQKGDTANGLIKRADEALYEAKSLGKNRYVVGNVKISPA